MSFKKKYLVVVLVVAINLSLCDALLRKKLVKNMEKIKDKVNSKIHKDTTTRSPLLDDSEVTESTKKAKHHDKLATHPELKEKEFANSTTKISFLNHPFKKTKQILSESSIEDNKKPKYQNDPSTRSPVIYTPNLEEIIKAPELNEEFYIHLPIIESQILQFTLNETRVLWLIHLLVTKSETSRLDLIKTHDQYLTYNHENNLFEKQLEIRLKTKYPLSYIVVMALSSSLTEFDRMSLDDYFSNQYEWNYLLEIIYDSTPQYRTELVRSFEMNGIDLRKKIESELDYDPSLVDLTLKLLDSSVNEPWSNHLDINMAGLTLDLCILFKIESECEKAGKSVQDRASSSQLIRDYKDLNKLLSTRNRGLTRSLFADLLTIDPNACPKSFKIKYCQAIDTIAEFNKFNESYYYAQKINYLIEKNAVGYNLARIFLLFSNSRSRSAELERIYMSLYKLPLQTHIEFFYSKMKKSWWKLWKNDAQHKRDAFVYVMGLKAMLDSEAWCTNNCQLVAKIESLKADGSKTAGSKPSRGKIGSFLKEKVSGLIGSPFKKVKNLFG